MEDIDSFWTFQESADELKLKIQYMTNELEITRKEANEEIRKNNENIKKLLQLLQTACKERDEAKFQLKSFQQIMAFNQKPNNFIDQIIPTTTIPTSAFPAAPLSPDSPLLTSNFPTKANSGITESSSFSIETQTNNFNNPNNNNNDKNIANSHPQSHVSSPILDSISSPDSSNIVFTTPPTSIVAKPSSTTKMNDQESLIIANMAKGRPLPTRGKLLQTVIEAGPLLSTLMVAGSLPQWRNPPGALTHQIPPVNLKGCVGSSTNTGTGTSTSPSVGVIGHNKQIIVPNVSTTSSMYNGHVNSSSGSIGIFPSPMLEFGSGSCFMGGRMIMNSGVSFDCQIPERQRIV